MGAGAGAFDLVAFGQQGRELLRAERVTRLDRGLAAHHVQHRVKRRLGIRMHRIVIARRGGQAGGSQLARLGRIQQVVYKIHRLDASIKQQARERVHPDGPRPQRLGLDTQPRQQRGQVLQQRLP